MKKKHLSGLKRFPRPAMGCNPRGLKKLLKPRPALGCNPRKPH